jgi:osomolarity two-component system sensor histidine kinase SLN1
MGYSAPIIALTAFSEESNVKECMDSGMNMFLSKPIRRPALKQALKRFATIPEEPEPTDLTWNNAEKNVNGDKGQSHPSNPEKPTDVTDLPTKSNTIPTDSGEHPASPQILTTRHPPPYSPPRSPISNGDKENLS